jgi:flagellar protein FliL
VATEKAAEGDAPKPKSKKMLFIIIGLVLVLAIGGGAAFMLLGKKKPPADGEEMAVAEEVQATPKGPPTFLPIDTMVVNLADPGGDRFAQLGITLDVMDNKTAETLKLHMPTIRNGILMAASRRTAEELLSAEGKAKLAEEIQREALKPLGINMPKARPKSKAAQDDEEVQEEAPRPRRSYPVRAVLFSNFIVQ